MNIEMVNFVQNGGFDDNEDIDPWFIVEGIEIKINKDDYYDGTQISGPNFPAEQGYSLQLTSNEEQHCHIIIGVPGLTPKNKYVFAYAMKKISGDSGKLIPALSDSSSVISEINLEFIEKDKWYTFVYDYVPETSNIVLAFELFAESSDVTILIDTVYIGNINSTCFSGESIAYVKNIETEEISYLPISQVYSDTHLIYRTDTKEFEPIIFNAITGTTKRFMKIPKDLLGPHKPYNDLYIMSGHRIHIDEDFIKAGKIIGKKVIRLKEPEKLYTICTEKSCPIWLNGLDVMTYSINNFNDHIKKNHAIWTDNKPNGFIYNY